MRSRPPLARSPFRLLAGLAVAILLGAPTSVRAQAFQPSTIELLGTIRDFHQSHPDMQYRIAVDPGIVEPILGPDGKPVYTTSRPYTLTTHGRDLFDQWYRDVPGVNLAAPLPLTLTNSAAAPDIYTFDSSSFFPIDGQLFGNEGQNHNYSFTFELHTRFTYRGGETFQFRGDDDVFVFVNHHLVIDLGGVHGPLAASVALDSVADQLGLSTGGAYDLDFFFAERYCCGSNFRMQTSILLEQPPETGGGATLDYEGDLAGDFDDPATLAARLMDDQRDPPAPIPDSIVTFTLGDRSCQAPTDAEGRASCPLTPDLPAGDHDLEVVFAGDVGHPAADLTETFAVRHEQTALVLVSPSVQAGPGASLRAVLREDGALPLAGRTVTFSSGALSATAVTDAQGAAASDLALPPGAQAVAVAFAGDDRLAPASVAGSVQVLAPELVLVPSAQAADAGSEVTVSARLLARGADRDGLPVRFRVASGPNAGAQGSCPGGLCVTDASGEAALTYPGGPAAGEDTVVAFVDLDGDGLRGATEPQARATVLWRAPRTTALLYTGASAGDFHDPVTLAAVLEEAGGTPVAGARLHFELAGEGCSATTGADGRASCPVEIEAPAGAAQVNVSFDGDLDDLAAATSAPFTVTREQTVLALDAPPALPVEATTVSARLAEDGALGLAGRTVTFTAGDLAVEAVTDAEGVATAALDLPLGVHAVEAAFDGDAFYQAAFDRAPSLVVYEPGQFVIWGGNAPTLDEALSLGDVYPIWGAQWDAQVTGGSYAANASFKGYADTLLPGGTAWEARTGNASSPPATVSAFTSVIVATSIAKEGSTITGDVAAVGIVRVTDPAAYLPDPGHPAYGELLALLPAGGPDAIVRTPPGPPGEVQASASSGFATVSWSPPADAGSSPVSGYSVTVSPGGVSFTASAADRSRAIPGLSAGTPYSFAVVAHNAAGDGTPSATVGPAVPRDVPGAPSGVAAEGGDGELTVHWQPPGDDGGAPITGYRISASPGGASLTVGGLATSATLGGLLDGVRYAVVVRAVNALGSGPPSVPALAAPAAPPAAPGSVLAAPGDGLAVVYWSAPSEDGGAGVTSYLVTVSPGATTVAVPGDRTRAEVPGLANGTAYTFTVRASGPAGDGPASAPSPGVTPFGPPAAPVQVAGEAGNASARVTWSGPGDHGGRPVTGYLVGDGSASPGAPVPAAELERVLTGLANGSSRSFTVTAVNDAGPGAASEASEAVVPSTVPGPPSEVAASAESDGTLSVSWTAPEDDGGAVVESYRVEAHVPDEGVAARLDTATAATSASLEGLDPGTQVLVTVRAANARGLGPQSPPAEPVTPSLPPGPPTGVLAVASAPTAATVSWLAPDDDGGTAIASYTVTSEPDGLSATVDGETTSAALSGLTLGTPYTFTVVAQNAVAASDPSAPSNVLVAATVPDPPTGVSAVRGDRRATVTWTPPAFDGYSPISSYVVVASPGGASATVDGGTTSAVVGGLANGTAYTFAVRAANAVGSSDPSAPSNPVTPATAPGAPGDVQAAVAGDRAAEVTWSPPADDGASPVTGYTVLASPGDATVSVDAATTTARFEDLTPGTAYTFRVSATNAVGAGPLSAPSNAVIAATVPGAPTAVAAVDGDGEATVSWTAPADDGASPVTSYRVVSSPGGIAVSVDGDAASARVQGLANGTTYTFTVAASNAIGEGPLSAPSNEVTPATVPGAPLAVTAEVGGDAAARVQWAPPAADGGAAITAYTVLSNPGGLTVIVDGEADDATVHGLVLGGAYTFTVTATNRRGEGPPSAPSNAVTAVAVPDPPTDVAATAGDAEATVSWTAPADQGGGPVLSYRVVSDPGAIDVVVSTPETTATVTGLDNGTSYTFTVTATNAVGDSPPSEPSNAVTPEPPGVVGLSSLAVNAGRVIGGTGTTGTVTLTGPAAAGGATVELASSDPATATVPTQVVVAEGATSATFAISTSAVAAPTDVSLSATLDATTLSITLGVDPVPSGTPPTAEITAPADDASVTAPTEVVGTATAGDFDHFVLEIGPAGETAFTEIARGTDPVAGGVLGTLDPTVLPNDLYTLRLTVFDTAGQMATSLVTVQVEGQLKIGNFTLSFVDVAIPVSGLPVTVTRTYDSRDKGRGDFGVGWRLDLRTLAIRDSGLEGVGWHVDQSGGAFPFYSLRGTRAHAVSLRLPGGQVAKFDFTPTPASQALVPLRYLTPAYTARPGTRGSLRLAADTTLQVIGNQPGDVEVLDLDTVDDYDPQTFVYTGPDGREWLIDKTDGVRRVSDPNGNTLEVGPGGITSSSGAGVVFTRDGLGRITAITDPDGGVRTYGYDAAGDLVAFTDASGATTTFAYDGDHLLTDIFDPLGRPLARNEYDDDGRLISTTDAAGNEVDFTHDLAANQEVVRDRLGNVQVLVYDDAGNVVSETDKLGNTSTTSYDDAGRWLSHSDPLGNTTTRTYDDDGNLLTETDPLGNTRSTTYGPLGVPLTETDLLGQTTHHTYDGSGNLLTTTDPLGHETAYTRDGAGNPLTTTDALGFVTTRTFDASGRETSVTDALGHTVTEAYDAKGDLLSESRTRTVGGAAVTETSTTAYDAEGRVITQTNPTGATSRTEYDVVGKIAARIDPLGNRTDLAYDFEGHLAEIDYPDGTTGGFEYDAEGRKVASTDRAGRTTRFVLDAEGHVLSTVYPDGATESATYDAAGRKISETDARGNTTSYEYDAAGRRTAVTDPLGHVTRFAYDAAGHKTSETDAAGNTTSFEYDAAGRMTRKTSPDGSEVAFAYDAVGHKISETDAAGNTTRYAYDGLGHVVQVTDALGGVTSYGYDEAGNRTSITDANGHVTTFAYDGAGREVRRVLPMGEIRTREYDAAGNLVRKVDAAGAETLYEYDEDNRLVRVTTADGAVTETTYTATGKIATQTDARGVTAYAYDARDRLTRRDNPDGTFVAYTYDPAGNVLSGTTPSGTTTRTYDALSRLASVTDPTGGTTTYTYDAVGNLATVTFPNGTRAVHTYDRLNRLVGLENLRSDGTVISSYAYTLGPAGNRLQVVEGSRRTVSYTYDDLYRLTGETVTGADPTTLAYTYDAVGNRLTRSEGGATTASTYDADDRLLTEGASVYTYDQDGDLATRTAGGVTTTYAYDGFHRMVRASAPGRLVVLTYDSNGDRASRTVDGVVTRFLVDSNRGEPQVLEERDGAGALTAAYVQGLGPIAQVRAGGVSYYGLDGLGSVRALTDPAGAVTDTYDYDAFGELLASTGSTPNDFRFAGEQLDANVGFYYLRARYYDPHVGRFTTADTFPPDLFDPETLHRYVYAANDPVDNVDPSGHFATVVGLTEAVELNTILETIQPTFIQGAVVLGGVEIFFRPGFELRNLGLHLMERALDEEMWEAATEVYENGQELIVLGAEFIHSLHEVTEKLEALEHTGLGVIHFVDALRRVPTVELSVVEIYHFERFESVSYLIETEGFVLFHQIESSSSITVIRSLAVRVTDWTKTIDEGIHLLRDLEKLYFAFKKE